MTLRDRQPGASLARIIFFVFARGLTRLILRVLFGAKGEGTENVPQRGPLVIVANHQSYLDPPAVGSFVGRRHTEFLARASLFKYKPFAWLISLCNSVPIQDDQGDAAAIREILRRLEMGRAVLIFPEGSRTPDGVMHEFKRGAALIIRKAKCPVIPAAITGAYDRWPEWRKWPRLRGPRVLVKYGNVIPYEELMKDGSEEAMKRLRDEVVRLKGELESPAGQQSVVRSRGVGAP